MSAQEKTAYGCVFCATGKETYLAGLIERIVPQVRTVVALRETYRSVNGVKTRAFSVMLPGYIFFKAPAQTDVFGCFPKGEIFRILTTHENEWQLYGSDERFAHWLFERNGLLAFSKAWREGDRIRMISGPLRDLEGFITKVDKRGCSGQVRVTIGDRTLLVWLGFELVDEVGAGSSACPGA